jgi:dTDP-glucose pyrophosphorylase/predicted transcriptional regulator
MKYKSWKNAIVSETDTVKDIIKNLLSTGFQICLIVNKKKKLIGTITDGDLRSFVLDKKSFNTKIKFLMNKKPFYADEELPNQKIFQIMKLNKILQLPILNKNKNIVGLKFLSTILNEKDKIQENLIFMAGGKGLRLRPLTNNMPKPMIKINGKPLLEKLILDASNQGFVNFTISINYLANKIKNYFKEGKKFGVSINYVKERAPLGTAGSLGNLNYDKISDNFIVANSDLVTNINYKKLLNFHYKNKSDLTLAYKPVFTKHSYSVILNNGIHLKSIKEKPTTEINYGIGIYVLNKKILKKIKKNEHIDMIDLILKLKKNNKFKILSYPMYEDWKDIGEPDDVKSYEF